MWWGVATWYRESRPIIRSFFLLVSPCISIRLWKHQSVWGLERGTREGEYSAWWCERNCSLVSTANKAKLQHFHWADITCLSPKSPYSTSRNVCRTNAGKLEWEHKWFTGSLTPRGPRCSVGAAGETLNMQRSSCQLAAGRRQLAPLTALVGTDIFSRIVTSHMPLFFHPRSWIQTTILTRAWNKTGAHTYCALSSLNISLCSLLQRRGISLLHISRGK